MLWGIYKEKVSVKCATNPLNSILIQDRCAFSAPLGTRWGCLLFVSFTLLTFLFVCLSPRCSRRQKYHRPCLCEIRYRSDVLTWLLMFWWCFLTCMMKSRVGRRKIEVRCSKRVKLTHALIQKIVMMRLILLIHRCEVFLSTILIKIFEGIHIWHHKLNLSTTRSCLNSSILRLFRQIWLPRLF